MGPDKKRTRHSGRMPCDDRGRGRGRGQSGDTVSPGMPRIGGHHQKVAKE